MKNQRGYPHGKDKHVERKKRVDERAAVKSPPVWIKVLTAIEEARADVAAGRITTTAEMRKRLGRD